LYILPQFPSSGPIENYFPTWYHRRNILKRVVIFMIYTRKENLSRYLGLSAEMDTAIRYLQTADLRNLIKGRNEIDGDRVFVNRFDYQTMPREQAIWEGHIRYADIHVLLSGREKIGVTNAELLTETVRKPDEDFVGFEGDVLSWFPMTPEDILIVFPEDIHMVKVMDGESILVEKACFKVKV